MARTTRTIPFLSLNTKSWPRRQQQRQQRLYHHTAIAIANNVQFRPWTLRPQNFFSPLHHHNNNSQNSTTTTTTTTTMSTTTIVIWKLNTVTAELSARLLLLLWSKWVSRSLTSWISAC